MQVGIDIEQFVRDPYGSGIQRVLQQLARNWPSDEVQADFVAPVGDRYALLEPEQAAALLSVPFEPSDEDVRDRIDAQLRSCDCPLVSPGDLLAIEDAWFLPEVSYLPEVLDRLSTFARCMPTAMIGYDTFPMSEPANYRFAPGKAAWVSEYFRLLAQVDSVVCISDIARDSILNRLRRDRQLAISVAHPGGDHVPIHLGDETRPVTFLRLGTLEARKMPLEILSGFVAAQERTEQPMELWFVGGPSASDAAINRTIDEVSQQGVGVRWIQGASDAQVLSMLGDAGAFLSIGVEGYGIPVLEAIRRGTPVLFDGVQPAAELMAGKGATHVPALEVDAICELFVNFGNQQALEALRSGLDPESVPTWQGFTSGVIDALRASRR